MRAKPFAQFAQYFSRRTSLLLAAVCLAGLVWAQGLQFSDSLFKWMDKNYGSAARERVENLQQLIARHSQASELDKLERVNDFFNRVEYNSDYSLWDRKDYWATPFEVLGINSADCEDYALSKFFTLISMGIPEEKLRVTYVKAIVLGEAHMVLAYYPTPDAEPLILDNLTDRVRPASKRTDLVPVYSFNGTALWVAVNRVEGKKVGGSDRLSRWQAFQKKLQEQMGG
jgi:predicted transglutaminase-like cysteine proteinase